MILDCRKLKFISILISKIALTHFFKVIEIDFKNALIWEKKFFNRKRDQYFFTL